MPFAASIASTAQTAPARELNRAAIARRRGRRACVAGDVLHARYLFEFGPRQPGRSIRVRVEAADRLPPFALDGVDLRGDLVLGERHAEPDPLQQRQPSVSRGYQRPATTLRIQAASWRARALRAVHDKAVDFR